MQEDKSSFLRRVYGGVLLVIVGNLRISSQTYLNWFIIYIAWPTNEGRLEVPSDRISEIGHNPLSFFSISATKLPENPPCIQLLMFRNPMFTPQAHPIYSLDDEASMVSHW